MEPHSSPNIETFLEKAIYLKIVGGELLRKRDGKFVLITNLMYNSFIL
jgi:hypothetical protein